MKKSVLLKYIAIVYTVGLFLTGCGKNSITETTHERIATLCSAGKLSTAEYTVAKVLKAPDCEWCTIGDRKILFTCRAYLEGGIDMSKYDATKTIIDVGKHSITIVLPKAELLSVNMPADHIKLKYTKVSTLRMNFTATERNDVLRQGENDIRNDIDNLGILVDAEANATTYFTSLFKQIGFTDITINFE